MLLALRALRVPVVLALLSPAGLASQSPNPLGAFTDHLDVGAVLHAGSATYDPAAGAYTITGSGENMWFDKDQFHFVWKKVSGDMALSADIDFVGTTGDPHRKAVLMMRQTLDTDSPAVDVALHGNGLTSLQFRDAVGAHTQEVEAAVSAPLRVRLEKRGDRFYAFFSGTDGKLHPAGASIKVPFSGEFYVGLGVCAHDKNVMQTAVFTHVAIHTLDTSSAPPVLWSVLETVNVASTDRRVAYLGPAHFEAPNWSRDGSFLLINQTEEGTGRILRLAWDQTTLSATGPSLVPTGSAVHVNNDHGISPDGRQLAISDNSSPDHQSHIYLVPVIGGTPRQVTPLGPSYWHGWSPDGKTLAFTGQRSGNFDIYTISVDGGVENRLTFTPGLDDGPEYSPDGQFIYFNSERSGHMQIWRMHANGSNQELVLSDSGNDWFPHLSPDGRLMAFLQYDQSVSGHPGDKDVELLVMNLADHTVRSLARLFGGQGTINVPSWSPDGARLAFVSYEWLAPEAGGAD